MCVGVGEGGRVGGCVGVYAGAGGALQVNLGFVSDRRGLEGPHCQVGQFITDLVVRLVD